MASACLTVCVIKMALRRPRLQRPHAKATMNDFKLGRGVRVAPHLVIWRTDCGIDLLKSVLLISSSGKTLPGLFWRPSLRVTGVTHNRVKTWHVSVPCSSETHICRCPKGRYDKWESSSGIPPRLQSWIKATGLLCHRKLHSSGPAGAPQINLLIIRPLKHPSTLKKIDIARTGNTWQIDI